MSARERSDAAVINDSVSAAQVFRSTFYDHFGTTNQLPLALAAALSDEVSWMVDPLVLLHDDPVGRFTTGTRLQTQTALRYSL